MRTDVVTLPLSTASLRSSRCTWNVIRKNYLLFGCHSLREIDANFPTANRISSELQAHVMIASQSREVCSVPPQVDQVEKLRFLPASLLMSA